MHLRWKGLWRGLSLLSSQKGISVLVLNKTTTFQPIQKVIWPSYGCCIHSREERNRTKEIHSVVNTKNEQNFDPDTFGLLESGKYEAPDILQDDDGEAEFFAKISDTGRPRPFDYLRRIEDLVKPPVVNLKEALDVFEVEMKKEYVKPIPEIYRVLIHACGLKGYSDKAFALYRQYTSRKFPVNFCIFADLFNACANCPKNDNGTIEERALRHAKSLRLKLTKINKNLPQEVTII